MAAYATLADVRASAEADVPSSDDTRLSRWLDTASRALDRVVPDIAARITAGALLAVDVRDVVVDAVLRRWRNPQGYASESAGDYSYTYARTSSARKPLDPSGWFTDGEVVSLRPVTSSGPRTIRVGTPFDGQALADSLDAAY